MNENHARQLNCGTVADPYLFDGTALAAAILSNRSAASLAMRARKDCERGGRPGVPEAVAEADCGRAPTAPPPPTPEPLAPPCSAAALRRLCKKRSTVSSLMTENEPEEGGGKVSAAKQIV